LRSRLAAVLDGTRHAPELGDFDDAGLEGFARALAERLRYHAGRRREEGDGILNEAARTERLADAVEGAVSPTPAPVAYAEQLASLRAED
jgi:hypothetical protein